MTYELYAFLSLVGLFCLLLGYWLSHRAKPNESAELIELAQQDGLINLTHKGRACTFSRRRGKRDRNGNLTPLQRIHHEP